MSLRRDSTSKPDKIWTPANIVTFLRICLVPLFVVALLSPWPEWFGVINVVSNPVKAIVAAVIFVFISCTDWIDGYLARSRGEVTDFGKFLDPLADKILVTAALIALVELQALPAWPVLIILTREFIVSGIRMIAASKGYVIAASWYGKAKTVFQIIAVVMFLVKDYAIQYSDKPMIENPFYIASWVIMIIALILTVLSMLDYIAKARPLLWPSDKIYGDISASSGEQSEFDSSESGNADAAKLVRLLDKASMKVCTAESLTGGLISSAITSVPGSSNVFAGGFVTYAISSKHDLLNVDKELLEVEGAVDPEVARQMALGAANDLNCEFAISATGIAGPGGAEPGKPVGTVYIGISCDKATEAIEYHFVGDRDSVRRQTVECAIGKSIEILESLNRPSH